MTDQRLLTLLLCATTIGCRPDAKMTSLESVPAWHVEPGITIGAVDGEDPYVFEDIGSILTLPDGSFVVAEMREIRLFDDSGVYRATIGRAGSGPGEFSLIDSMYLSGDTIIVFDIERRILSLFDSRGSYIGQRAVYQPHPSDLPRRLSATQHLQTYRQLPDGSVIASLRENLPANGDPRGYKPQRMYVMGPGRATVDLGEFAPPTLRTVMWKGNPVGGFVPFSVEAAAYVSADGTLYVGNGMTGEVHVLRGNESHEFTLPWSAEPISDDDAEDWRSLVRERATNPKQRVNAERFIDYAELPKHKPYFSRLLADDSGRLWLGQYVYRTAKSGAPVDSTAWIVTDSTGRPVARVMFPPRFIPRQIASGTVVGVLRDDDDVAFVQTYHLK